MNLVTQVEALIRENRSLKGRLLGCCPHCQANVREVHALQNLLDQERKASKQAYEELDAIRAALRRSCEE